jgi:hypothetical protein
VLTHVVMWTLADPADVPEAKARLEALPPQIPAIRSLTVGVDALGDPDAVHFVLITTHDDADGLAAYASHPVHQEFGAWLKERRTTRTVVDYYSD